MQQDLTFRGYLLLCRRAPGAGWSIVAVGFAFVGAVLRHGVENALLFGGAAVVAAVVIFYRLSRWWIRRRGLPAYGTAMRRGTASGERLLLVVQKRQSRRGASRMI